MEPFAAKFGYSKQEYTEDKTLDERLMDEYARSYGFSPDPSWVILVLSDSMAFYTPLKPDEERWCCRYDDLLVGISTDVLRGSSCLDISTDTLPRGLVGLLSQVRSWQRNLATKGKGRVVR